MIAEKYELHMNSKNKIALFFQSRTTNLSGSVSSMTHSMSKDFESGADELENDESASDAIEITLPPGHDG